MLQLVSMRKAHLVHLEKQRRLATRRTAGHLPSSPPPLSPRAHFHMGREREMEGEGERGRTPPPGGACEAMLAVGLNPIEHPDVPMDLQLLHAAEHSTFSDELHLEDSSPLALALAHANAERQNLLNSLAHPRGVHEILPFARGDVLPGVLVTGGVPGGESDTHSIARVGSGASSQDAFSRARSGDSARFSRTRSGEARGGRRRSSVVLYAAEEAGQARGGRGLVIGDMQLLDPKK